VPPLCDSLGEGASFFAGGRATPKHGILSRQSKRAAKRARWGDSCSGGVPTADTLDDEDIVATGGAFRAGAAENEFAAECSRMFKQIRPRLSSKVRGA
jgi:hypothetical protein